MVNQTLFPFGNPDGSRTSSVVEDSSDSQGYIKISFDKESDFGSDFSGVRVIVGRKGSGKTIYLRRYNISLIKKNEKQEGDSIFIEDNERLVVPSAETRYESDKLKEISNKVEEFYNTNKDKIHQNAVMAELIYFPKEVKNSNENIETSKILSFTSHFSSEFLTEKWKRLWRCAILRTVVSYILHESSLKDMKEKLPKRFKENYARILSRSLTKVSIYSQITEILEKYKSVNDFNKFFNDIYWNDIDQIIGPIIKNSKPLYFFIDAIDDEYQQAPNYWLRSQKGLFYAVMQFMREFNYGNKLHIIISLRDHAYLSILRSEHKTRYISDSHIVILKWNNENIKDFLFGKLRLLDKKYFSVKEADNQDIIANWCGIKNIFNDSRNCTEEIYDYLFRHTRAIPRDIILLGNQISNLNFFANELEKEASIKNIVKAISFHIGDELIDIVSNHIASDLMPHDAVELGIEGMFTSKYQGEKEYLNLNRYFGEKVKNFISIIGKDRFSNEELFGKLDQNVRDAFGGKINHILDIFWLNGIIGVCIDEKRVQFFSESNSSFFLPTDCTNYAFHSIIIDVCSIKSIGLPVYPIY